MFERIPFRGQVLLFSVLSALIVLVAYFVYPDIAQMQERIGQARAENEDLQRKIREGRTIEQNLPKLEQEIASLERKLADVQQILPSTPETGDLLRWIKNLADQSNLELKSFVPGAMRAGEFYKEFPISMDVVGRYHDLGIFFDRIGKYSRIINVDNLEIQAYRGEGEKTIRSKFVATTFVYDEQAGQTEAGS